MRIKIDLPYNRYNPGKLVLLSDDGEQIHSCPALGKADNQKAIKNDNSGRDPVKPWGDTPEGVYAPAKLIRLPPPWGHLGKYFIPLEGIAGQALLAKQNGRTGLGIHAGRGDEKLIPTNGCVRVLDADMFTMFNLIGDNLIDEIIVAQE